MTLEMDDYDVNYKFIKRVDTFSKLPYKIDYQGSNESYEIGHELSNDLFEDLG